MVAATIETTIPIKMPTMEAAMENMVPAAVEEATGVDDDVTAEEEEEEQTVVVDSAPRVLGPVGKINMDE